jgi:hypothetical protein
LQMHKNCLFELSPHPFIKLEPVWFTRLNELGKCVIVLLHNNSVHVFFMYFTPWNMIIAVFCLCIGFHLCFQEEVQWSHCWQIVFVFFTVLSIKVYLARVCFSLSWS